ncbi:MAG: hypothetical protein ABIF01_01050 [Candidatus Micrarchaeota archaeon]
MVSFEQFRKSELRQSRPLIESISSFTASDILKIQDPDVLRYVVKFSKNQASRKRALSELVRMESAEVLEYISMTTDSDETKKLAINGLARLGETEPLKRLANSRDEKTVAHACAGLFRNANKIIRELDIESLDLLSKSSKNRRQKKEAERWLAKMKIVEMIKKFEK